MIQFTCNGCGESLQIADKWAARPVRCLYCGIVQLVPGRVRRPSRLKILFRLWLIPLLLTGFWWLLIPEVGVGMLISLVVLTFILWLLAHVVTFLMGPRQYFWELRKGIDPFFDGTLPWPINPDPDWVKFV